jgi:redox-sensitive bicupin YhaK (pirin superfamily)
MITVRYGEERGRADLGWLDSRHSFSFADYFDPKHMGFGPLRVINEDRVREGGGFDTHGHRDMEIISYVLEGELEHKDSIGTGSVIRPGDVQRMTAGAGVRHSEFNPSQTAPVHFLQIWIMPDRQGLAPSYEQKHFADADKKGRLRLIASAEGGDGSVKIHQDAKLFAARLDPGDEVAAELAEGRLGWLQVARGVVTLNGQELRAGDGAAVEDERRLVIASLSDGSEVLLFDLPR